MKHNENLLSCESPLTPVSMRCLHQEYREGYVRGYTESATTLMNICELVFKDADGVRYIRERFAAKIEDAAAMLDDVLQLNHPS